MKNLPLIDSFENVSEHGTMLNDRKGSSAQLSTSSNYPSANTSVKDLNANNSNNSTTASTQINNNSSSENSDVANTPSVVINKLKVNISYFKGNHN
jgi:hypothetical protein